MKKKYTLTAALPYANGALHLGHLAGVYVPSDIYARFLRLKGEDVLFVCGSDEHGAAITMRAKKEGITPQEIIDKYHSLNKDTFEKLGISFDIYDRTSNPIHHKMAQEFFTLLNNKGEDLIEMPSEQYYDEKYNQFLADRYIMGTCPKCNHADAYGDQCEACGSDLSPTELINPRSTLSGATPVLRPTSHWYFRLDKHAAWLEKWVKEGVVDGVKVHDPNTWRDHVKAQCLSWVQGQLQPRAITRDLDWGIPVPVEGAAGKVLYVWFDAPIGYISATKVWADAKGKNWEDYWKGDDVELVHFIGKDNIVFHTVIFPAMLHAHGEYALPKNVPANQFLNLEGKKFSKSRGWVIEQHEYLKDFASFPAAADALRYALARTAPEQKDGDFKWDDFVAGYDNELADNLGNFINRVMSFSYKYFEGKVPNFDMSQYDNERKEIARILTNLDSNMTAYRFRDAVQDVMELSRFGNGFLQEKAPWLLYKANPEDQNIANCIGFALQIAGMLSSLMSTFIPFSADRLRAMLGLAPITMETQTWADCLAFAQDGKLVLPIGHQLGEQGILFAKIQDKKNPAFMELVQAQQAKLEVLKKDFEAQEKQAAAKAEAEKQAKDAQAKPLIEFPDFEKLDLRIATIKAAERVAKSDKLLKLTIDLGYEERTVVSGIGQSFAPEQIIGQQVTLVANLQPRKMMGIMSQGMVLMANDEAGKLVFVTSTSNTPNGGLVK